MAEEIQIDLDLAGAYLISLRTSAALLLDFLSFLAGVARRWQWHGD